LNKPKLPVKSNPLKAELNRLEVNTEIIQQKKICQLSLSFQKEETYK